MDAAAPQSGQRCTSFALTTECLAQSACALQASLRGRPHLAAAAAGAVAFRQTNAVWAALILGTAVLRRTLGDDPRRWAGASAEAQLKYALRAAWQVLG